MWEVRYVSHKFGNLDQHSRQYELDPLRNGCSRQADRSILSMCNGLLKLSYLSIDASA